MTTEGEAMKFTSITIIILIATTTVPVNAGSCWKIKNRDQKAYCESIQENKRHCWLIKDQDLKALCETIAYGKRNCWLIKDKDKQAYCEGFQK